MQHAVRTQQRSAVLTDGMQKQVFPLPSANSRLRAAAQHAPRLGFCPVRRHATMPPGDLNRSSACPLHLAIPTCSTTASRRSRSAARHMARWAAPLAACRPACTQLGAAAVPLLGLAGDARLSELSSDGGSGLCAAFRPLGLQSSTRPDSLANVLPLFPFFYLYRRWTSSTSLPAMPRRPSCEGADSGDRKVPLRVVELQRFWKRVMTAAHSCGLVRCMLLCQGPPGLAARQRGGQMRSRCRLL